MGRRLGWRCLPLFLLAAVCACGGVISPSPGSANAAKLHVNVASDITKGDASWFMSNQPELNASFSDYRVVAEGNQYSVDTEAAKEVASDLARVQRILPGIPSPGLRTKWQKVVNSFRDAAINAVATQSNDAAKALSEANDAYAEVFNQLVDAYRSGSSA